MLRRCSWAALRSTYPAHGRQASEQSAQRFSISINTAAMSLASSGLSFIGSGFGRGLELTDVAVLAGGFEGWTVGRVGGLVLGMALSSPGSMSLALYTTPPRAAHTDANSVQGGLSTPCSRFCRPARPPVGQERSGRSGQD